MDGDRPSPRASSESGLSDARFFGMSIDILAVIDLETTILEINPAVTAVLGYEPPELQGRRLLDYFHPDDVSVVLTELAGLLEDRDAVGVVVRVRSTDGSYRWLQGNARPDLTIGRIYVTAADITERVELEEALRRQLALEELVATITARFIAADGEQVLLEIERAIGELARAVGADRAHFLRGSRRDDEVIFVEWLHPEWGQRTPTNPAPAVQDWWRGRMQAQELVRIEDVRALRDEYPDVVADLEADHVKSVLLVPLPPQRGCWGFLALVALQSTVEFSDDATALLGLAGESFMTALARNDDATALLDARRELEVRNEELERSNEELERFAYAAAHDLKAPLARIEMALGTTPRGDEESAQLLDIARRGAHRLRQMIEDLLAFSAVGSGGGEPEDVDLDDVLTQVLVDLDEQVAAAGARVLRQPLPTVSGRPILLGQLLQNLLGNALKFTRPGTPPEVEVSASRDDDGVALRVTDNGIGIPPARRREVFGVFRRLDPDEQYPGSGIGLATCAKVVAQHGGRIWVEDGVDGGSTFVVWLPDRPPVDR